MSSTKLTSSLSATTRVIHKNSPVVKHFSHTRQGTRSCASRSMRTKSSRIIHVSVGLPRKIFHSESNRIAPSRRDLNSTSSAPISTDSQYDLSSTSKIVRQAPSATRSLPLGETTQFHRTLSRMTTGTKSNACDKHQKSDEGDQFSSTRDLMENSKNRKENKSSKNRCAWVLGLLAIGLLLAGAIAGALAGTLIKSDAPSTSSSTDAIPMTTNMSSTITTTSMMMPTNTSTTTTTSTSTTTTPQSTAVTATTITLTSTTTVLTMAGATPSSSVNSYGGTENIKINCTTTLTNLTIQVFVRRIYGATYSSMYSNSWGGTISQSYVTNVTHIIYTWSIVSGQVITCSAGPYTYTAQFNSNGTAQVTSGDFYTVSTRTSSGVVNTFSGYF